ncbi:TrbG/VirB9 family P-type conjugative transfer protein [Sphingomonas sp.]|jgi:type IV secretion system protein VirB9|uniref:TrbG/VirB9 family P-type conjugative transfer protein n=1 Tax=Sphingomonas sp. TaxID=28214 RepID=UPI002ED89E37
MRSVAIACLAMLLWPAVAHSQIRPQPGAGNPHIQSVDYIVDQVVILQSAPGYQISVEFAPDEHIETVAVGDGSAWQVTANKRGDRLFVKPLQQGGTTNMTVVTDARVYAFELASLSEPQPDMAYSVQFRYPPPVPAAPENAAASASSGRYKLSGELSLRPSGMHDDGTHTYIEWPPDRPLPAIYAPNDQGQESLVNGMMREGRMVIDSVQPRLVFRIDRRSAGAMRLEDRR